MNVLLAILFLSLLGSTKEYSNVFLCAIVLKGQYHVHGHWFDFFLQSHKRNPRINI